MSPLPPGQEALNQMIQAAQDAQIVNYAYAACMTWVLYDLMITMPQEMRLVWRSRLSLHTCLFYIQRYFSPMTLAFSFAVSTSSSIKYNLKFCHFWFWFEGLVSLMLPEVIGDGLLVMRVYALYGRSRKVLAFLSFLYIGRFTVVLYSGVAQTKEIVAIAPDVPIPGCVSTPPDHMSLTVMSCIATLVTSSIFFLMTLYKFLTSVHSQTDLTWKGFREMRTAAPIFHLFLLDGSAYFLLLLCAETTFVVFMTRFTTRQIAMMGFPFVMSTYTVGATRLVLNLRGSVSGIEALTTPTDVELNRRYGRGIVFATPSGVESEYDIDDY